MENTEHEILEELKKKSIERDDDLEIVDNTLEEDVPVVLVADKEAKEAVIAEAKEPPKKTKKQRSAKQIAAFEKARLKRAENLKIKKQMDAEKKEQKKAEKEQVKKEVEERLIAKQSKAVPVPFADRGANPAQRQITENNTVRFQSPPGDVRYREQVVNNYYYYGHPPPHQGAQFDNYDSPKPKSKKKKKRIKRPPTPPPVESSSESESESEVSEAEEPESYKELQNYQEDIIPQYHSFANPQKQTLKFKFV